MKQVLFEEDGAFRVGTILSEAGASFQVEAAHGKRSKVKAGSILLRFDGQALGAFMPEAQKLALPLDPKFLWEVSGREEFGFDELAREYFGRAPTPQEVGGGRARSACEPDVLLSPRQGALPGRARGEPAGRARRRREEAPRSRSRSMRGRPSSRPGAFPSPSRQSSTAPVQAGQDGARVARARRGRACARALTPQRVLALAGALAGPEDFFLRRFAFEFFPQGHRFRGDDGPRRACRASANPIPRAFSIDDEETTEIDDAFSVRALDDGNLRVGVHIAAPAVFFSRAHALEAIARERLSTVYFPGGKITMLPQDAVRPRHARRGPPRCRPRPSTSPSIPRASRCAATNRASSGSAWRTTCAWPTWTRA